MPKTELKNDAPPARVLHPIRTDRIKLAQFKKNDWQVAVPDDLEISDLETPSVWALGSGLGMRRGDRVETLSSKRWSEFVVYDDAPGYVAMKLISTVELPPRRENNSTVLPAGYSIRRATEDDKAIGTWVVIKDSDGSCMNQQTAHHSFEEARNYLLGHASVRQAKDTRRLWHEQ